MNYIDRFVCALPKTNKQSCIEHAQRVAAVFREYSALRTVECRGEDVPDGELTSFPQAVRCKDDETICFSWIEWPSRAIRNESIEKVMADARLDLANNPMPLDGMRLIYGGFESVVDTDSGQD